MKKQKLATILAIDTSCDETSAAVTKGTTVLSNIVASQTQLHAPYGGVFPTVAKQAHEKNIDATIKTALKRAQTNIKKIDAFAVTTGPGLAPALEVGINKAKALTKKYKKPLIAVNHIEGHVLSVLAERKKSSKPTASKNHSKLVRSLLEIKNLPQNNGPILSIVVSGGHTQFILTHNIGQYQILGSTIDDAAGECLDKVGRILGLGYPAGPIIEKFAKLGDPDKFKFPLPMTASKDFNLSFSGLKTYSRNLITKLEAENKLDKATIYDFSASFQKAVFRHICYKLNKILQNLNKQNQSVKKANNGIRLYGVRQVSDIQQVWLGGGVAANITLRKMIRQTLKKSYKELRATSPALLCPALKTPYSKKLCGDNAAMIGVVAGFKYQQTNFVKNANKLDRKPRWSLS